MTSCTIHICLCSVLLRMPSAQASKAHMVDNTTLLLDELLSGYDKRLRPGFGGGPTIVDVNLNVRSMGPISETDMAYQMDCYFRQSWVDSRLVFRDDSPLRILNVSVYVLEKIWKPDTSFFNGKKSHLHTVTTPNKLLRINRDGRILYSMRLTIKASCPMHLENFPMDTQSCPLKFGSHGYDKSDVQYIWTHGPDSSIKLATDMLLSQFDLIGSPAGNETFHKPGGLSCTTLVANFILRRHMGYFLINLYVPCSMLVVISWVGFWINREATADRIALGITTVLTMAFLGIDNRRDLPKVSYSTALDYFVGVCFAFVLAAIIQFAGVHFFTKHGSGEVYIVPEETSDDEEETEDEDDEPKARERRFTRSRRSLRIPIYKLRRQASQQMNGQTNFQNSSALYEDCSDSDSKLSHPVQNHQQDKKPYHNQVHEHQPHTQQQHHQHRSSSTTSSRHQRLESTSSSHHHCDFTNESCLSKFWHCLIGSSQYRTLKMLQSGEGANSVSTIDRVARMMFPLTFFGFHLFYWISYLKKGSVHL